MTINFSGEIFTSEKLKSGILELARDYGYDAVFGAACELYTVTARHGDERRIEVNGDGKSCEIVFDKKIHFFRALGLMLLELKNGSTAISIAEDVQFDTNGPMFDVSQGSAVINLPTLKRFMRNMALLGMNMLMLYCEDSYDVEGEPYFGYMRSRYSEDDMRKLDDYADMFGIEMIPCIQTLAHLYEALKWAPYKPISDYSDCLLVGEEKTYGFIRNMLISASRPFRTKRIHIGMDEAWRLGQGEYLIRNGLVPRDEIMRRHLNRVMEIVRELGLEPMMWGDMFFNSPGTNSYYNSEPVRQEAIDAMPEGMRLVYWDYYHNNSEDFYLDYIDKHRLFCEPLFAGGIWTWCGYGANWGRTFNSTNHVLSACKRRKLREVFVTVWGDADTECDINATLPGLVLYAEHGYSAEIPSEDTLRARFEFVCGGNYDDFMALQLMDHMGEGAMESLGGSNPSKCLMWQDIMCGLFDKNIDGAGFGEHYANLAAYFADAKERGTKLDFVMELYYRVCDALALKAEIGLKLTKAYKSGDTKRLEEIMKKELRELRRRMTALRDCHHLVWRRNNKALGWEVFDARYGVVLTRIDTACTVIQMYLDGEIDRIDEFEEERLGYNGSDTVNFYCNYYNKIAFSSRIAWELS